MACMKESDPEKKRALYLPRPECSRSTQDVGNPPCHLLFLRGRFLQGDMGGDFAKNGGSGNNLFDPGGRQPMPVRNPPSTIYSLRHSPVFM